MPPVHGQHIKGIGALMGKNILIIGAGVAGLSAGCYGQMNGFSTKVLEMHNQPGGMCTAWTRGHYTLDGCIHWLVGTKPGTKMNRIWGDLGALQDCQVAQHEIFRQIVVGDRVLNVYTDPDALEEEMLEKSDGDEDIIREFTDAIRGFIGFEPPLDTRKISIIEYIRMLPYLPKLMRYQKVTIGEFTERFTDPFLKKAFRMIFPLSSSPLFIAVLTLALMSDGDAGCPTGGSLAFAKRIERRYLELGGQVSYRSKVVKILIEGGRATGVLLDDGSEVHADHIVSACDGHHTLFDLIGEEHLDQHAVRPYQVLETFKPIVYVSMGVDRDMTGEPPITTVVLDQPIEIAGGKQDCIGWAVHSYDPSRAPPGKCTITSMIETDYGFWRDAHSDRSRYECEKRKVRDILTEHLETRYPGIGSQIEVVDVATPLTWERYTGVWQGAYEGWMPSTEARRMTIPRTLEKVENFSICGQWVEPGGGVPPSAISGRNAIRDICRREKVRFHGQAR